MNSRDTLDSLCCLGEIVSHSGKTSVPLFKPRALTKNENSAVQTGHLEMKWPFSSVFA